MRNSPSSVLNMVEFTKTLTKLEDQPKGFVQEQSEQKNLDEVIKYDKGTDEGPGSSSIEQIFISNPLNEKEYSAELEASETHSQEPAGKSPANIDQEEHLQLPITTKLKEVVFGFAPEAEIKRLEDEQKKSRDSEAKEKMERILGQGFNTPNVSHPAMNNLVEQNYQSNDKDVVKYEEGEDKNSSSVLNMVELTKMHTPLDDQPKELRLEQEQKELEHLDEVFKYEEGVDDDKNSSSSVLIMVEFTKTLTQLDNEPKEFGLVQEPSEPRHMDEALQQEEDTDTGPGSCLKEKICISNPPNKQDCTTEHETRLHEQTVKFPLNIDLEETNDQPENVQLPITSKLKEAVVGYANSVVNYDEGNNSASVIEFTKTLTQLENESKEPELEQEPTQERYELKLSDEVIKYEEAIDEVKNSKSSVLNIVELTKMLTQMLTQLENQFNELGLEQGPRQVQSEPRSREGEEETNERPGSSSIEKNFISNPPNEKNYSAELEASEIHSQEPAGKSPANIDQEEHLQLPITTKLKEVVFGFAPKAEIKRLEDEQKKSRDSEAKEKILEGIFGTGFNTYPAMNNLVVQHYQENDKMTEFKQGKVADVDIHDFKTRSSTRVCNCFIKRTPHFPTTSVESSVEKFVNEKLNEGNFGHTYTGTIKKTISFIQPAKEPKDMTKNDELLKVTNRSGEPASLEDDDGYSNLVSKFSNQFLCI